MNLKLKEGESVIKSWDYAKVKGRNENELNLTVTSDRIISTDYNKKGLDRKEIFIKDVKSFHSCTAIKGPGILKRILALVLLFWGVYLFVMSAIGFFVDIFGDATRIMKFVFILPGVLCIWGFVALLKKKKLFALKFVLYKNIKRGEGGKTSALIPYIVSAIITFFTIRRGISLLKYGNGVGPVIFADVAFVVLIALWIIIFKKYPISYNKVQGFVKKTGENKNLKLKVNSSVAKEIMQEIGAIMLDGKAL